MKLHRDISKFDGTIGNLIENNFDSLMSSKTPTEVLTKIQMLFADKDIHTTASSRMLYNLLNSKSLTNSLQILTNSLLASKGLAVC